MAVRLEGTIKRYIGLSTDAKPNPAYGAGPDDASLTKTDVLPGSSFLESDTGKIYRYDGTEWRYGGPAENPQELLLAALLLEVRELRETISLVTA